MTNPPTQSGVLSASAVERVEHSQPLKTIVGSARYLWWLTIALLVITTAMMIALLNTLAFIRHTEYLDITGDVFLRKQPPTFLGSRMC